MMRTSCTCKGKDWEGDRPLYCADCGYDIGLHLDALREALGSLHKAASRAKEVMRVESTEELGVLTVLSFECDEARALLEEAKGS